jgi:hypothetical protein
MLSPVSLLRHDFLARLLTSCVIWVRSNVAFLHDSCRGSSTELQEYYDIYCVLLLVCTRNQGF